MENNIKTNDWFATRILNNDKDPVNLIESGITPINSTLQSPDFYKNKTKVQQMFVNDEGKFDEDKFNNVYNSIAHEFEYLSAINTENLILDAYEKSESNFTTDFGKVKEQKIDVTLTPNPLNQSQGINIWNKWSDPTISNREAAQTNQYYDPKTNTWSEKTLNELGALGLLTENSLAYAIWDEDGEHIDPMTKQKVLHKKGEWKTDEFGNYYAEKVYNEESLNKQFVTLSEVLTTDGSAWNKIDIFDSDNLESNIPRSLLRAVAIAGSLMIPYIRETVGYSTAAINLARVLPQVAKTLTAFFNEDAQFDKLNTWDNNMRKFGHSASDYAQEHFFSFENIMNLAVDSFMQLRQQRLIAELPKKLGMFKAAEETAQKATLTTLLSSDPSKVQYLTENPEVLQALTKANALYRDVEKMINRTTKISNAISRAYLITTSTEDVYNQARSYGFDTQTSSMIALATYVGIGALFQTNYFRGILYNTPDYELKRDIKIMLSSYLKNNAKLLSKDVAENTTNDAKKKLYQKWGGNIINFLKNHIQEVKSGRFGIISGAISEGVEEVTEEGVQDIALQIGKGWNSLKSLFTGKEYSDNYNYFTTDPLTRYGTAFFGGALGGAIFKLSDRFLFDKSAYKNWRKMLGDNSELSKEFVTYISQGKTDLILKEIDKLQKTPLISTELSAFDDSIVAENSSESQNAVLFGTLKKAITDIDSFLTNNNLKIDYEKFGNVELIRGVRAAWLNSSNLQNSLFEDYLNRVNELSQLHGEIASLRGNKTPNMEASAEAEIDKQINQIQEIIDFKINQVRNLVQGKDDSYIGRLMLESNKDILNSIVPTTKDSLAKNMYNRSYDNLPKFLQEKINTIVSNKDTSGQTEINYVSAWNLYKNLSSNASIKNQLESFNDLTKNYNPSLHKRIIENGQIKSKNITSINEVTKEFLFDDLTKILKELPGLQKYNFTEGQYRNIAYRMLGLTSVLPNIYGNTAIISPGWDNALIKEIKDEVSIGAEDIINKRYYNFINIFNSIKEKIQSSEDQKVLQYIEDNWDQLSENVREALTYYGNTKVIEKSKEELLKVVNSVEDTLIDDFNLDELPTFSVDNIDNVLNTILKNIIPESFNIQELINRENERVKDLGNQYVIDDIISAQLNNAISAIKLLNAIVAGSDENYRTVLAGTPFGANNYLNQAFKEKGLNIELPQLTAPAIEVIQEKLTDIYTNLNNFIELDAENRGAVINQEKQLGLDLQYAKLSQIQKMFNWEEAPEVFKDYFNDFQINISEPKDLKDDESFIKLGVEYRNQLLDFERRFAELYNSLTSESKIDLVKWIVKNSHDINKPLYRDATSLTVADPIKFQEQDFYLYLLNVSFGNTDLITKAYIDYTKEVKDLCPFDSQEEVIIQTARFILNNNPDSIKLWIDEAANTWKDDSDSPDFVYHAIKSICSGGTGKTSTIIPAIYSIIKKVNPEKNCIFAANTKIQISNLLNVLPNDVESLQIGTILSDATNETTFKNKYQNSTIIIDESTNISIDDIKTLDNLASKYNVTIVYFGDTKQHSAENNIDYLYLNSTIQLTESKRASTDISRINNVFFEKLFAADDSGNQSFTVDQNANFMYYEDAQQFEGIKFDSELLTQQYIEQFFLNHNLDPNTKVLVLSKNIKELVKNNFNQKYPNIEFVDNVADIQGSEWDYTLTDIDLLNVVGNIDDRNKQERLSLINKLKDVYTIFTRHKHGLVALQPLVLDIYGGTNKWIANKDTHNELSKFKPIVNGLTQEAIDTFKEFKSKVLDQLQINTEQTYTPEKSQKPTVTEKPINTNSSVAQITPGFVLKEEFEESYISNLKISKNEYFIVRNILYQTLTDYDNKDQYLKQLPLNLQNGEFRIKVQFNKTEDLYNLGNKYRDQKALHGIHPWIVYSVNIDDQPVDITLGMFHNAETSETGGLKLSQATQTINQLAQQQVVGTITPEYYAIDFNKIKFSRSMNPIAIQNRETNDSGYINIVYQNGQFNVAETSQTNAFNFANTTAAFYFAKGDESIVPVNQILDELAQLKSNYASFEKLAIQGGIYENTQQYNDIIELLSLDRRQLNNPDLKKQWKARSVPDLEGRFCSFVSLNVGQTSKNLVSDLKTKSTLYLEQIKTRNRQVEQILQVLKNDQLTVEDKRKEVKQILSNKLQWKVSILTYDNDTITNEKDFDAAINGLQINKVLATSRNRAAYNLAIGHQIGLLLMRLSTIINDSKTRWGTKSEYLNKQDVENIKKHWAKYSERLVDAYTTWTGQEQTEATLLEYLSRSILYNDRFNISSDYFINSENQNILQSEAFLEYLRDIYISDSLDINWKSIINKTNGLKYIDKFKETFSGHVFPELLKDNGLSIQTKGDSLSIHEQASFKISSKVIQPAQIYAHIDDTITVQDFVKINTDVVENTEVVNTESVEQTILPKTDTTNTATSEVVTTSENNPQAAQINMRTITNLNKQNKEFNRTAEYPKPILKPNVLRNIEALINILLENSPEVGNKVLTQLYEILNNTRTSFELDNLSSIEQKTVDQIEVILEDNEVIKIC